MPDATPEPEETAPQAGDGGQWLRIAFMGHVEYAGYVTEVTRNGQPAYRIELPDYLWGEDPSAWVEHSASSWYSSNPVNDRALRRGWETARRRKAEIAQWEARQRAQPALGSAEDDDLDDPWHSDGGGDDD
jgi:hypothetical protein